jgi:ABC-type uncharacterized transport system permease subunit
VIESLVSIGFLLQTLRISVPYILPALGATVSERGGVVNIALEGILLVGAFATTVGTAATGSPLIGILCGVSAGIGIAAIHGLLTVYLKTEQIVCGIALNLLAFGLCKFLCQLIFHSSSNSSRIVGLEMWQSIVTIPVLSTPYIPLTILLVIGVHLLIYKTRFGLRLRAVGEHPQTVHSLGISVSRLRFAGVLISGALAGLGGTWLALDQHNFTDGMSAGRGFIALAAMIVGKWKPINATLACLFFGLAESVSLQLQGAVPYVQFVQMIPYLLTIIVLAGFIGRSVPPAADGVPFSEST